MTVLIIGAASLLATAATAPLVRALMLRRGIIDVPNQRSSHDRPTPRGGGVACAAGIFSGSSLAVWSGMSVPIPAVAAALLLAALGLLDDRFQLAAMPRLATQVITGALFGATIGGIDWVIGGAILMPLLVNVVNFMDGINGITALTLLAWGSATAIGGSVVGVEPLSILGAMTAGAALGFLPFNAPQARIFLGDVGSYLFGALAATGVMLGTAADVPLTYLVAPLLIYVLDVTVTLGRRAIRGRRLLDAHREHTYQRLVALYDFPHITVAISVALLSLTVTAGWASGSAPVAVLATAVAISIYFLPTIGCFRTGLTHCARKARHLHAAPTQNGENSVKAQTRDRGKNCGN
ncbi:hypothetical protein V5H98_15970 [Georgenia sp. M64]|uniref:hypothetical protein n=1 Tax=Georgenia sp. M64 TaxID=3120520 RepID=UPI0030E16D92